MAPHQPENEWCQVSSTLYFKMEIGIPRLERAF